MDDLNRLAAVYFAARAAWLRSGWSGPACDPTTPAAVALAAAGRDLAAVLGPGGEYRAPETDILFRNTTRGIEMFIGMTTATTLKELTDEQRATAACDGR